VASDINEKAFYGKILRTKTIIEMQGKRHQIDQHLQRLSPRSQEIAHVMQKVGESFKKTNEPPETTLDFYRIGKMLGRGAFGKVNLAMHKLVRKLVALKSLNKECLKDEDQKQKLMKEVNLLLKLRHDSVVKIYETIETKKHIIIVMELCAGGDLLNYVRKRRRLKEPYAKKIFKQIIDGLRYVHSKHIAHRDVKLDNILLDGKGQVKIADFGVSKQITPGTKMREQCGTPAYIAPEILRSKNGYTCNVDLWSAGVVLYAMLYGTVPFKAASMEELHSLILRGVYTLKDDVSQEARDMLRGLLEINPHKRLGYEEILNHPWLADFDPQLQLFNDQEREMIKKEYTYNDPSRYNRNENEEPVDCFTEHDIDSVYNTLKNCSEKSVILAPFNSTQSEDVETFKRQIRPMMMEKNLVLRLSRLCREVDRQYEFNNNGQLDNGVYHKQINNSVEDAKKDKGARKDTDKDKKKDDDSDDEDEELKFQVMQCSRSQGRDFSTEDFENEDGFKATKKEFINNMMANMTDAERKLIESTFGTNNEMEIDELKIEKLVQYGYPNDYLIKCLHDNSPNYITAGYYLLKMDQNYC